MREPKPQLGGSAAVAIFVLVLVAFTVQSDLTTYVQSNLGFRKPYFLFYVAHSSFTLVFPIHLLYLYVSTTKPLHEYLSDLKNAVNDKLSPNRPPGAFPTRQLLRLLFLMLLGLNGPGLLWYVAVSMASVSDVTALWNTNAFWAYVLTVQLLGLSWERRKLFAVVVASLGTFAIVYGGIEVKPSDSISSVETFSSPKSPLLGNFLALIAAVWYATFQVLYKLVVALPNDPELHHDPILQDTVSEFDDAAFPEQNAFSSRSPPPFGLHSNFLLSSVGLLTLIVGLIPFPILTVFDIEPFGFPPDLWTLLCVGLIATMGLIFNSGFMILLGLWGPIIASVGGLLTIILVLISDVLFVEGLGILTIWNFFGSCMIVAGFTILASEFRQ